ncbi:MAG: hypothetical protein OEO77_11820, partial [Acidimicrobiia bacterium]|nr:hypothetical protein [Acidimicrobiia bacterium]
MIGHEERTAVEPALPPAPSVNMGRIVGGALIMLLGVAWIADLANWTSIRWDLMLPAALIVVGLGVMYGATKTDVSGLVAIGV